MGTAFVGQLPPVVRRTLQLGDFIVVGSMGAWASWAVMYLTKSEISHIAVVLDQDRIVHAVPDRGVVIDPIERLLLENNRLLVGKRSVALMAQREFAARALSKVGSGYDFLGVLSKGVAILVGRVPGYFRVSFIADIVILLLALDAPALLFAHHPVVLWLLPVYMFTLTVGTLLGHIRPYVPETPASLLFGLIQSGSTVIGDAFLASQQKVHAPGLKFEVRRPTDNSQKGVQEDSTSARPCPPS